MNECVFVCVCFWKPKPERQTNNSPSVNTMVYMGIGGLRMRSFNYSNSLNEITIIKKYHILGGKYV